MINDLEESLTQRPLQQIKSSHQLSTIIELERNQLLTYLQCQYKFYKLPVFFLAGNRSYVSYVEGSTAWLYECPRFLQQLYKVDRCFDCILIHFKDTLLFFTLILLHDKHMTMLLQ